MIFLFLLLISYGAYKIKSIINQDEKQTVTLPMSNIYISSLGRYAIDHSFRFKMDQKINDYKNAQTCFCVVLLFVRSFIPSGKMHQSFRLYWSIYNLYKTFYIYIKYLFSLY